MNKKKLSFIYKIGLLNYLFLLKIGSKFHMMGGAITAALLSKYLYNIGLLFI